MGMLLRRHRKTAPVIAPEPVEEPVKEPEKKARKTTRKAPARRSKAVQDKKEE